MAGGLAPPRRQLAFFPADQNRLFVLDPAVIEWVSTAAARAVLFTKHGSGSLRSPPSLVGPYLFLNEASDLEHTRVKAFSLLEGKDLIRDPDLATAKEIELAGWSWFETPCTADRITVYSLRKVHGSFSYSFS